MKNITFGFSVAQFNAEVPIVVKYFYRTLMFLSGVFYLVQSKFNISTNVVATIDQWVGFGNILVYYICQFFSIPEPDNSDTKLPNFSTITTAPISHTGTLVEPEITNINGVN
jgi:hypothetical protein